ncbi:LOW QUALITY PROTEIN: coiled-coil domain-containing protein 137 [Simochromis diagramma]|uniref:LOW QUALITY PROTEIN: coiled-coil domain-containing protein 137 n=1 Tax=Simochromis diagramma TaxID=43689 RepID=UPI001A7EF3E7|nr:LOW QUALITY PROTEIN: coiled-coil domain-containing protein 137 [Simochromis diagramma]
MGKNKKNKVPDSGKQAGKPGQRQSNAKLQRDGKPKKAKEVDHIQHIPFKLREIMKAKDRMKTGSLKVKKPKKDKSEYFLDGDIPVPHFKRGKRESVKAYVQRMERETKHVMFLSKNQVDRSPEMDASEQERPAHCKSDKKKEYGKMKLQKLQQKKVNKQEDKMEEQMFIDDVPFGEVTMAPPSLSAKPRKAEVKSQKASKELLLNSLLGHTAVSTTKPSMAKQRIMEEERERAVEAYRQLKKQKQQQYEARTASMRKLKSLH